MIYLPRKFGQALIVIYQRTLSPDHGPLSRFFPYKVCKFEPTCSEYGYTALGKYGLIKGSWKTFLRILRCNPWSRGGNDPVV
ncbi:MAG: membrane protein insertion efficiency factor YidD [Patescibacteria group bacterium]